LGEFFRG